MKVNMKGLSAHTTTELTRGNRFVTKPRIKDVGVEAEEEHLLCRCICIL
jgi:hypothetical protein